MIKQHKWKAILSSLLILSPMAVGLILWDKLPDSMVVHWGSAGVPDGTGSKAFAVFGLPLIMLALHWLALLLTALDPKQKGQNKKAMGALYWIMPILNLFVQVLLYGTAMGKVMDIYMVFPLLFGFLFMLLGNYQPKVKQNSTYGVKMYWTLNNEENWNKTHRFAGKVWVAAGAVMVLTALLPLEWMLVSVLVILLVACVAPVVYSYRIYKKHKAAGIKYTQPPRTKGQKITAVLLTLLIVLLLTCVVIVMFTGEIEHTNDGMYSITIDADYADPVLIRYEEIEDVWLVSDFDKGVRSFGFGSARLSLGTFQNEELGTYTLYAYNACDAMIVIKGKDGAYIAFNGKDMATTLNWFERIECNVP